VQVAAAGLGETTKEVTVLGEKYSGLIHSLNMMARLVPISLFLYYIGIVLLIM